MGFIKGAKEWNMFAEFYVLCEKWWNPPKGNSYEANKWFDEMWRETDEFRKKYHAEGNRFAEDLIMAFRDRLKDITSTQIKMDTR